MIRALTSFFCSIFLASSSLFFASLLIAQDASSQDVGLPNFYDNEAPDILAEKIVSAMTHEELLSQIFMFGWKGDMPGQLLLDWIEKRGLGNIKVFGWNTKDSIKLAKAISLLQKKALQCRFNIPLFVATDQEGGLVRHVKGLATYTPGNLAIGASGIPYDAYKTGYYIALELKALGINLNFAPTVDLYTNYDSSVIGIRSFGERKDAVSKLAIAFMQGTQAAGVIATAKHFPGHGDTKDDSHGRLPKIDVSREVLFSREIQPFKMLIDNGLLAIMTAHINYSALSEKGEPATFSRYILKDILRENLGFDGIIITDDIMMQAAHGYAGGFAVAVQKAIEAGNNLIESSRTPLFSEDVWQHNLNLMKKDKDFYLSVRDSAKRVITLKLRYFKSKNHVDIFPDIEELPNKIPLKESDDFFLAMAARSVTVVRGMKSTHPYSENDAPLIVASTKAFLDAGKKRYPNAILSNLESSYVHLSQAKTVICCLEDVVSLQVIKNLIKNAPKKRFIIVSLDSPIYLKSLEEAKDVIAVYSSSPFSFTAAFSAVAGDFIPYGKMPLINIK